MLSRRSRIQEKKATKKGLYLFLASIALLGILAIFGVQILVQSTNFVSKFKSPSAVLTGDNTPPGVPQAEPTPPQVTRDNPITINGRSEPDSIVTVYLNNEKINQVEVGSSSKFSFSLNLKDGENRVYLTASDKAGNTSPSSTNYLITYDNTPPTLDVSKPQEGATYYSPEQTISIEGTTEKDASVTINDRLVIINNDGSFSQKYKLNEGENILNIAATDKAGNQTTKTIKVTYSQ